MMRIFHLILNQKEFLINTYKPDILHLAEADITTHFLEINTEYNQYNFEVPLMYNSIGIARNILMVNKNPFLSKDSFIKGEIKT